MASLNLTIKQGKKHSRKIVEFSPDEFERLAALFGMFNKDFLKSIARAEKDIKAGRITKLQSLKDLR